MNKKLIDKYIDSLEKDVDKPFITPRFGDNWKDYARQQQDYESLLDIAWRNGRLAIILERALRRQLELDDDGRKERRLKHLLSELYSGAVRLKVLSSLGEMEGNYDSVEDIIESYCEKFFHQSPSSEIYVHIQGKNYKSGSLSMLKDGDQVKIITFGSIV